MQTLTGDDEKECKEAESIDSASRQLVSKQIVKDNQPTTAPKIQRGENKKMNRSIKPILLIMSAFVLCLMLNAAPAFAQEVVAETKRKTPPMPNSEETRCLTVTDCDRLIQALVVELWKETAISQKAEKSFAEISREREELQIDRDKWRQLYTDEKQANTKLAAGNLELTAAVNKYKSDNELNKNLIEAQNKKIRRFRLQNYIYSGVSFGAGFGLGRIR